MCAKIGLLESAGFTLIETLVAISLLTVAIVAPMSLTAQSLASAYYARDQITASYLAQEAIEAVRSVRDGNILLNSQGTQVDLLSYNGNSLVSMSPFTIDTRNNAITLCPSNGCPALETDGNFYGYGGGASGWTTTQFTRSVSAILVGSGTDEVKISVVITWRSGAFQERSFSIAEDLYRWVNDGSGAQG
ncbi:prepilin-type N-terminal cleavage/methylation domain-containing protein [Candidatus Kaiserbacteria bacterium]|nr:prepilin-type N-terminal cleavage/methylation domain-containing protein [Candidatus Kaiserbacteria bacterium]